MDCSAPGSLIHGIFQAWILEWVAISFSRGSSRSRDWTRVSRIVGRCFTIQATREARKKKKKGKDTNKQKYITCSWIGRVNTVLKCPYYPESPIDLMQSLIKFQWHFSQKQIQSPNSYGTKNDSEYWKESRETTTWGIMFSDFKHYYKDIGIKILWYYH